MSLEGECSASVVDLDLSNELEKAMGMAATTPENIVVGRKRKSAESHKKKASGTSLPTPTITLDKRKKKEAAIHHNKKSKVTNTPKSSADNSTVLFSPQLVYVSMTSVFI